MPPRGVDRGRRITLQNATLKPCPVPSPFPTTSTRIHPTPRHILQRCISPKCKRPPQQLTKWGMSERGGGGVRIATLRNHLAAELDNVRGGFCSIWRAAFQLAQPAPASTGEMPVVNNPGPARTHFALAPRCEAAHPCCPARNGDLSGSISGVVWEGNVLCRDACPGCQASRKRKASAPSERKRSPVFRRDRHFLPYRSAFA